MKYRNERRYQHQYKLAIPHNMTLLFKYENKNIRNSYLCRWCRGQGPWRLKDKSTTLCHLSPVTHSESIWVSKRVNGEDSAVGGQDLNTEKREDCRPTVQQLVPYKGTGVYMARRPHPYSIRTHLRLGPVPGCRR